MKHLFLLVILMLCAVAAQAQNIYPVRANWWIDQPTDLSMVDQHDSLSVALIPNAAFLWSTPRTIHAGEVDSIGVWCEVPEGAKLLVGTAWDHNNFLVNDSEALKGPLDYGLHFVPFHAGVGPAANVNYIVAISAATNTTEPAIDAACISTHGTLGVKRSIAMPPLKTQWYNELGIPDSLHGVIRH